MPTTITFCLANWKQSKQMAFWLVCLMRMPSIILLFPTCCTSIKSGKEISKSQDSLCIYSLWRIRYSRIVSGLCNFSLNWIVINMYRYNEQMQCCVRMCSVNSMIWLHIVGHSVWPISICYKFSATFVSYSLYAFIPIEFHSIDETKKKYQRQPLLIRCPKHPKHKKCNIILNQGKFKSNAIIVVCANMLAWNAFDCRIPFYFHFAHNNQYQFVHC